MNETVVSMFAIFAIFIVPLLFVLLIVWIVSSNNRKKAETQAQIMRDIYMRTIESGKDNINIPDDLFKQPKKRDNSLKVGIILISTGIGLSLTAWIAAPSGAATVPGLASGIIPAVIGLGFLVVYFLRKKHADPNNEE